ncbi:MAG: hypothetical protein ABSA07_06445 [Acidimicrobiales bacterium]
MESPEYVALSEFVPDGSPDVLHPAYPELRTTVAQPDIAVEPFLNSTVPVAPVVTIALRAITEPTFWGPLGKALRVVVDVTSDGDEDDELLADGPLPPALEAYTLNV